MKEISEYERQQREAEEQRKSDQRFSCCVAIFGVLLMLFAIAFGLFQAYIKMRAWWNLAHM